MRKETLYELTTRVMNANVRRDSSPWLRLPCAFSPWFMSIVPWGKGHV